MATAGPAPGPAPGPVQASKVSRREFEDLLDAYPSLVEAISASKGANDGQTTLKALDEFRFGDAPAAFAADKPQRPMQLDDVQKLVEWKLRHGKFRPTLMKLVSSNDPAVVKDTVQEALDRVIFFSDEAFYWLCCNGKKGPIKYNAKEYLALCSDAQELSERLSVSTTDIEKVAFVLMRRPASSTPSRGTEFTADAAPSSGKRKAHAVQQASQEEKSLRRSKRTKS